MSKHNKTYRKKIVAKDDCPIEEFEMTKTDNIKIDFSQIPNHVREELASATIMAVNEFLRQPGGREFLDKKRELKKSKIEAQ